MPRPRTPYDRLVLSGELTNHRNRYRDRLPTYSPPIDTDPPIWMKPGQCDAWFDLIQMVPWLKQRDRGVVEIAAIALSRLRAGDIGIPNAQLLAKCLNQIGATPVSFARV
jgi:hypothetical protein